MEVSSEVLPCVSENRKESEMKKQLLMIGGGAIMMATAAFAGVGSAEGATRDKADVGAVARREEQRRSLLAIQNELRQQRAERQREEQSGRGDDIRIDAKHVCLRSVLGINEELLADTNRFAIVEGRTGRQTLQLDTPFGGFSEAIVYIDGALTGLLSRRRTGTTGCKLHRLHSVALRRWLPDTATDKDFLSEWQASCDFVASILGVGVPKVQLADVKEWRNRRHGLFEFRRSSRVTFNVANDQKVVVCLEEPVFAIRDGKFIVVRPGLIFINIDFNHNRLLCDAPQNGKGEDEGQKVEPSVKKEIDFGPDCADKLAKAIRDKKQANSGQNF